VKTVEVIVKNENGEVVYRTGYNLDLYEEYLKRNTNDLTTLWLRRIFIALFTPVALDISTSFSFTDTGGTARTQTLKGYFADYASFINTNYCYNRFWICYGSSSTAPSITDYKLGSKLGEGVATMTLNEPAGILTFSVSFTVTTSITVYEVGLEWEGVIYSYSTCGRFLVDRTVFPDGIPVSDGQILTIIYRILV